MLDIGRDGGADSGRGTALFSGMRLQRLDLREETPVRHGDMLGIHGAGTQHEPRGDGKRA
jgi:hypothetical protein